jgi:hypothetical protein
MSPLKTNSPQTINSTQTIFSNWRTNTNQSTNLILEEISFPQSYQKAKSKKKLTLKPKFTIAHLIEFSRNSFSFIKPLKNQDESNPFFVPYSDQINTSSNSILLNKSNSFLNL